MWSQNEKRHQDFQQKTKEKKIIIQDSEENRNPTVPRSQNQVGSSKIVRERQINGGEILTCPLCSHPLCSLGVFLPIIVVSLLRMI